MKFKIQDSTWQAIATLIGIVAIIISTAVAYDIYRKSVQISMLTLTEWFDFDPLQFGEAMKGRVALLVDGKAIDTVRVFYYSIENTGTNPIIPDDYIEPIQISTSMPWEIFSVETQKTVPIGLTVTWTQSATNTFEMSPTLLNPEDKLNILIFLTNPSKVDVPPEINWNARIINVRSLEVHSAQSFADQSGLGVFYTGISHYGWSIYWLAGLTVLLFIIGVLMGVASNRLASLSMHQLRLLVLIMALSFATSEIIVDVFIDKGKQWWGAWFILIMQLLLSVYLVWPLFFKRTNT